MKINNQKIFLSKDTYIYIRLKITKKYEVISQIKIKKNNNRIIFSRPRLFEKNWIRKSICMYVCYLHIAWYILSINLLI